MNSDLLYLFAASELQQKLMMLTRCFTALGMLSATDNLDTATSVKEFFEQISIDSDVKSLTF